MRFLLGKKVNMTQIFDEEGVVHPATLIKAGALTVTQVKTKEKDGYEAVQVGFGSQKAHRINKALKGHLKEKEVRHLKEFRPNADKTYSIGDTVPMNEFKKGDVVEVSAITKGKGFQGVVKRHGFGGGPRTHGQKHSEREAGSIGGGLRTKVPKNMRMAGRMGGNRVTVKNLKVLAVDETAGHIFVKGAVPGRRGTLVEIRSTL